MLLLLNMLLWLLLLLLLLLQLVLLLLLLMMMIMMMMMMTMMMVIFCDVGVFIGTIVSDIRIPLYSHIHCLKLLSWMSCETWDLRSPLLRQVLVKSVFTSIFKHDFYLDGGCAVIEDLCLLAYDNIQTKSSSPAYIIMKLTFHCRSTCHIEITSSRILTPVMWLALESPAYQYSCRLCATRAWFIRCLLRRFQFWISEKSSYHKISRLGGWLSKSSYHFYFDMRLCRSVAKMPVTWSSNRMV